RQNQLAPEEMKGSTFTITNLGSYGVDTFTPVLNPPETGILGIGAARDTPVYIGGELQRRSLLPLSLTFDHRVLDGAPAAAFLAEVRRYLEEPYSLLI
ncbi:2-oxo acid dehydrogenase subunit E2, partial [Bacillus sp. SIMBA_069]